LFLQRDLSEEALRQPEDPTFSEGELAQARQDGFDAGHKAGMDAAAASRAAARTAAEIQALNSIVALLADARKESARVADGAADALARTLVAAMDSVMPALIRRSALGEAGAMLGLVLPGLSREPSVQVTVSDEIADSIGEALANLPPELRDVVNVRGVPSLRQGEVRVQWAAGQARRQPDLVWQSVMAALDEALGPPAPKQDEPAISEPKDRANGD
jgi:hypothetical protein